MNNLSLSVFMPVIISFLISVVFCPILIPFLRKLKFGQTEREEGPQSHLKKNGTPTMGGLVILASILLTSLIYIGKFTEILPVLFMTLGFGLIGFLDDYIKVVKKRSLGLTPLQKMALQFIVTGVFIYYYFKIAGLDTSIKIPFVSGDGFVMPTWLFIIFVFIVVLGTVLFGVILRFFLIQVGSDFTADFLDIGNISFQFFCGLIGQILCGSL